MASSISMKDNPTKVTDKSQFEMINKDITFDGNLMNGLIDKEIDKMQTSKGWKSLPKSVKWEKIQEYYEKDNVKDIMTLDEVKVQKDKLKKAILENKQFDVSYNTKDKCINHISDIS